MALKTSHKPVVALVAAAAAAFMLAACDEDQLDPGTTGGQPDAPVVPATPTDPVSPNPVTPDPVTPIPDPVTPNPAAPDPVILDPDPVAPDPDPGTPDPVTPDPEPVVPLATPDEAVVTSVHGGATNVKLCTAVTSKVKFQLRADGQPVGARTVTVTIPSGENSLFADGSTSVVVPLDETGSGVISITPTTREVRASRRMPGFPTTVVMVIELEVRSADGGSDFSLPLYIPFSNGHGGTGSSITTTRPFVPCDQALAMEDHNRMRKIWGERAPLAWSEELADAAYAYAQKVAAETSCDISRLPGLRTDDYYSPGLAAHTGSQNLWSGYPRSIVITGGHPLSHALNSWIVQNHHYNLHADSCPGRICDSFRQMINPDTTHLGCGYAACNDGDTATPVLVCNYAQMLNGPGLAPGASYFRD